MTGGGFTIRGLSLRSVVVPMARPLVTRVVTIERAAFVLIDLETEEGITGSSYLFGYSKAGNDCFLPPLHWLSDAMKGEKVTPGAPPDQLFDKARKALTLMGHEGIAMIAVSGFDMACWDAYAQAQGQPLVEALGGKAAPVTAYYSCGLGIIEAKAAAEEAKKLLAEGGYGVVKVRLGRKTLDEDLAVLGTDVILPVDFNKCLSVDDTIERDQALNQENIYWIEEPPRYDDWQGNARIAAAVETPVRNGENFYGPEGAAQAIEAKALDYLMPDVERIGGVTGWMRAARIAEEAKIPVSSYLFPEFSSHLLAATPAAHWLEFTDWSAPLLENPVTVTNGHGHVSDAPSAGIAWNEDAVEKYSVAI